MPVERARNLGLSRLIRRIRRPSPPSPDPGRHLHTVVLSSAPLTLAREALSILWRNPRSGLCGSFRDWGRELLVCQRQGQHLPQSALAGNWANWSKATITNTFTAISDTTWSRSTSRPPLVASNWRNSRVHRSAQAELGDSASRSGWPWEFLYSLPTHATLDAIRLHLGQKPGAAPDCSWFGFMFARPSRRSIHTHRSGPPSRWEKIGNRMLFGGNLVRQPVFVQLKKSVLKPSALSATHRCGCDYESGHFPGTYPGLTAAMLDYEIEPSGNLPAKPDWSEFRTPIRRCAFNSSCAGFASRDHAVDQWIAQAPRQRPLGHSYAGRHFDFFIVSNSTSHWRNFSGQTLNAHPSLETHSKIQPWKMLKKPDKNHDQQNPNNQCNHFSRLSDATFRLAYQDIRQTFRNHIYQQAKCSYSNDTLISPKSATDLPSNTLLLKMAEGWNDRTIPIIPAKAARTNCG